MKIIYLHLLFFYLLSIKLLQFLMHLRGEPIGLSVGGLAVMTSLSFFRYVKNVKHFLYFIHGLFS